MKKHEALAEAIVNAFVEKVKAFFGKVAFVVMTAFIILWFINFFQGAKFQQGPGRIGLVKIDTIQCQYQMKKKGTSMEFTSGQKMWVSGLMIGNGLSE